MLAWLGLCLAAGAARAENVFSPADGLVSPLTDGTEVSGVSATASAHSAGATQVVYTAGFTAEHELAASSGYVRLTAPAGTKFSTDGYSYEVTDTTSGKEAQSDHVEVDPEDLGQNVVDVYVPGSFSVAAGATVTVAAYGATNPSSEDPSGEFSVSTSADTESVFTALPIGPKTSVSELSVSASTTSAGASAVVYTASFKATEALSNGGGEQYFGDDEKPGAIRLVAAAGTVWDSDGYSYEISDAHEHAQAIHVKVDPDSTGETNVVEVNMSPLFAAGVAAEETVTVEAYGVKNPASEDSTGELSVSTTSDVTPVSTGLPIGPATAVQDASIGTFDGVYTLQFVSPSNISNGDPEQFGDDEQPGFVTLAASAGTTLPTEARYYEFSVRSVQGGTVEYGVLHVEVHGQTATIETAKTIPAGSQVKLTIERITGLTSALISTSSDTLPVSVGATELAPLSGTVAFEGKPEAGATVQACTVPAGECQTTSTETAGAFTFAVPALAGARYALTANPPGANSHAGEGSLSPVVLGAGAAGATGLEIALPKAPGIAKGVSILTGGGAEQTSSTTNPFVPWTAPYELSLQPSFFPTAKHVLVTKIVVHGTNVATGEPEQQVIDAGGSIGGLPVGLELGSGPLTIDMPSAYPMHGEVNTTIDYRIGRGSKPRVTGVASTNVLDETYPPEGSPPSDPLAAYFLDYGDSGGVSVGTTRIVGPDAKYFHVVSLGSVGSPQTSTDCGSAAATLSQFGGSGAPPADTECGIAVQFTPPGEGEASRIYYHAKLRVATGVSGASTIPVALLGCDARVAQATGSTCYHSSGAGVKERASAETPFDPALTLKELEEEIKELEKEEKECKVYVDGHLVSEHKEPCLGEIQEEAAGGGVEIEEEEEEEGEEEGEGGGAYHDPSGVVYAQSAEGPVPLAGATVTLKQSYDEAGPFAAVPNDSTIMSPANRVNPGTTGADGLFGWDVLAGFYQIEAADSASGCSPASTSALTVPPPVENLSLTLSCTSLPSRSVPSVSVSSSAPSSDYGQTITFTAKIAGGANPTGTVTFEEDSTPIGEAVVHENGGQREAALTLGDLAPGEHIIVAHYSGDGLNKPAVSPTITQTVNGPGGGTACPAGATEATECSGPPHSPTKHEEEHTGGSGGAGTSGGGSSPPTVTCEVTLADPHLSVIVKGGHITATIDLHGTGSGTCAGTLALTAKLTTGKGRHRYTHQTTIGTGHYTIVAGKTGMVEVALDPAGRSLLAKDHGRLAARLTLSGPSASPPRTASALLVLQKAKKPKRH